MKDMRELMLLTWENNRLSFLMSLFTSGLFLFVVSFLFYIDPLIELSILLAWVSSIAWQYWFGTAFLLGLCFVYERKIASFLLYLKHWRQLIPSLDQGIALNLIALGAWYVIANVDSVYELWGEIAGIITFAAFIPYFVSIIKRETCPSRVTWWMWTGLELLQGGSYVTSGATYTAFVPLACALGMFFTALLSIWYGKSSYEESVQVYIIGAFIGIVLWWLLSPIAALVAFLGADFLAAYPTIKKSYYHVDEDLFAWVLSLMGSFIALFAIETYTFSLVIYPIYNVVIYGMVVLALVLGKKRKSDFMFN